MSNDLISRQAAIDEIKEIYKWHDNVTEERIIEHFKRMPSAQPQQTCEYWDSESNFCTLHRPSAQPEPQWIPCSERLPKEEKKKYWICTDSGYQCECRWTNVNHIWTDLTTDWHWHIGDVPQFSKVVAWMPLQKPWKGEQKGEQE